MPGVALVTGAGSPGGIGIATARALGEAGHRLAIVSTTTRIHDRAHQLRELGIDAQGFVADLTDERAVDRLFTELEAILGMPEVVVNNAGMGSITNPESYELAVVTTPAAWRHALETNVTTAFLVTRRALPSMIAHHWGRIVNVASTTGVVQVNPGEVGYAAGKAAMVGLTKAVALENARHGITCNALAPGWIASLAQTEEERRHGLASPMGRSGTPEEVAAAAAFLASEQASFITGHTLVVDGGNRLMEGLSGYEFWRNE
ncbi:MAG: SDR family oxidoreductase [Actinomycetota bacterium]|nr:SDR family oxidoreductase [Actinomycetota bacterium]